MRSYGHIPDHHSDERKVYAGTGLHRSPVSALPREFSWMREVGEIGGLYQDRLGTCVTQATIQGMRLFWNTNLGIVNPVTISRLGWYWDARAENMDTKVDSGLHPASAFDVLNKRGYALEKYWPYDESKVFTPPDTAYRTHCVDQVGLIDDISLPTDAALRVDAMKRALYVGVVDAHVPKYSVTMGITCDEAFEDYVGGVWQYTGSSVGRHYVLVIGWSNDLQAFLCANSWERWGIIEYGCSFFWVAYEEVRNSWRTTDVRAIKAVALPSEIGNS